MPFITRKQAAVELARRLAEKFGPEVAHEVVWMMDVGTREAARANDIEDWFDTLEKTLAERRAWTQLSKESEAQVREEEKLDRKNQQQLVAHLDAGPDEVDE